MSEFISQDRGHEFLSQNINSMIAMRKRSHTFPSAASAIDLSDCDDCLSDINSSCGETNCHLNASNDSAFSSPQLLKVKYKTLEEESSRSAKESNGDKWTKQLIGSPKTSITHNTMNQSISPIPSHQLITNIPSPIMSPFLSPFLPLRSYVGGLISPFSSPMYHNYPSPAFNTISNQDRVIESAKSHRNAATHADPRHTWSGILPTTNSQKIPVYSCKVFLGGVPWEMTDHDIKLMFSRFGNVQILRPGQHVKLSRSSQNKDKAGYLYLIFESDKQVKALLNACIHDFSNGGKYYFALNNTRYRPKDIQIIPWNVNDTTYVKNPSARVDANKTVFVGALHGMLTAEGLATILEDLFGGVVYVGIDTDKYKYPIGSGRVTFQTTKSYTKAVQAAFIDVKSARFQKKVQIDPFLEDSNCSNCRTEKGPIFCRDVCMTYFCRNCWDGIHATEGMRGHQPIMRTKNKV
ncbi:cytoplasmic polyadenylation element-binding protein 1-like [Oppia nitens]|uniref:cytoplasmic polyadenylation element-binding protein 1-like n=1 Tax=Oppia nitens TaxID=1686743 RepID=UPI0023DC2E1E|nr:cytoplasmic polyadenylation element-binding protein 1-like [Oppia nitens]